MELIRMYPNDMDKRTSFKLCNSNETQKMSNASGSILEVVAWALYTDIDNKTGDGKKVVSLMTADGEIFGTISETFIREFEKIADHFDDDVGNIKVIEGTSKSGRSFITCDIDQ